MPSAILDCVQWYLYQSTWHHIPKETNLHKYVGWYLATNLHDVISLKMEIFIITTVMTSNLAYGQIYAINSIPLVKKEALYQKSQAFTYAVAEERNLFKDKQPTWKVQEFII